MQQALERQFGASHVDLNTESGWAHFALLKPTALDFSHLIEVMESASYELSGVELEVSAKVEHEGNSFWLVMPETGQRIRLQTDKQLGDTQGLQRLRGKVLDWQGKSPSLSLTAPPEPAVMPTAG